MRSSKPKAKTKKPAASNGPAPLVVNEGDGVWHDHGLFSYRQHPGRRVLRKFKGTKNGQPVTVEMEVYEFDTEEELQAAAAHFQRERVQGPQAGDLAARLNEARALVRWHAERIVKRQATTVQPLTHSQVKIDLGDGPAGYRVAFDVPPAVRDAMQLLVMEQQLTSLAGQERDEHLFCMGGVAAIMQLRASERELLVGKKSAAGSKHGGKAKANNAPAEAQRKAARIAEAFRQACRDRPRLGFVSTLNYACELLKQEGYYVEQSTAYAILQKHPQIHEELKRHRKKKFF